MCVEMDRLEEFEDENDCENRSDDAASETDTQDGSIGKVTEAQECNRLSEQDVTVLREKWDYNEMEEEV